MIAFEFGRPNSVTDTERDAALREGLLDGRLAAIKPLLMSLTNSEQALLATLHHKMPSPMETTDLERCTLRRLCDDRVCSNRPIAADFRGQRPAS